MEFDVLYHQDCLEGMRSMPDGCVDLVITDPPYLIGNQGGGFWSKSAEGNHYNARGTRKGMEKLSGIKDGFDDAILDELCRVMKKINLYVFCSQKQIQRYLDYFVNKRGCNWNLLSWHKTNPIPACGNKYLNDTEYILFFREKGVRIYGTYETKRTYYITLRNQEDNVRYNHPTVKPLNIIRNMIVNSSEVGGGSFGPFHGERDDSRSCCQGRQAFRGFRDRQDLLRHSIETN